MQGFFYAKASAESSKSSVRSEVKIKKVTDASALSCGSIREKQKNQQPATTKE